MNKIVCQIYGTDVTTLQRNEMMLTQNYRAVYQFQDDQQTCSPASEENVQI